MTQFASLIQAYRKQHNLSRFKMAMRSGVTPATIEKLEAGKGGHLKSAIEVAKSMKLDAIPLN